MNTGGRTRLWLIRASEDPSVPRERAAGLPSAGAVIYPPGGSLGPRVQSAYELVVLHTGSIALNVDGQVSRVEPGAVVLLTPGRRVHFRFDHAVPSRHSWLIHRKPPLTREALAGLETAPRALPTSRAMAHLVDAASTLGERFAAPYAALAALIVAALTLYLEEARADSAEGGAAWGHPAVQLARAHVRDRLHERITLRDLAAVAHVAPPYLVDLFRRQLSTTPMRYVWAERVRQGLYLLEHTGLPVGDVAARCGFQTTHHFARRVRAETGATPTAVRRRSWAAAAGPPGGVSRRAAGGRLA